MDPKFQSSFIPKKPLVAQTIQKTHSSVSFFFILSLVVFILSLGSVGLVFAWERVLLTSQVEYQKTLQENRAAFGDEQLERFRRVNTKIDLGKKHLDSYIAVSSIFPILSDITTDVVRYSSFEYVPPTGDNDPIRILLTGEAASFNAIAFQSEVFAQAVKMKNIIMSDFDLQDNGNVAFTMTGEIPRQNIYYKSLFGIEEPTTQTVPEGQTQTNTPQTPVNGGNGSMFDTVPAGTQTDTIPFDELPVI